MRHHNSLFYHSLLLWHYHIFLWHKKNSILKVLWINLLPDIFSNEKQHDSHTRAFVKYRESKKDSKKNEMYDSFIRVVVILQIIILILPPMMRRLVLYLLNILTTHILWFMRNWGINIIFISLCQQSEMNSSGEGFELWENKEKKIYKERCGNAKKAFEKWNSMMEVTIIGSKEDDELWKLVSWYLLMMPMKKYLPGLIWVKELIQHSNSGENTFLVQILIPDFENLNLSIWINFRHIKSIIRMQQMTKN